MLRPERMSKVSVTGSKAVMDDVVEAIHDLHLVHLSEYNGSWDGFERGDPTEGAEDASQKLVTVRSLESILDVDPDDAGPARIVTDEELEDELEAVRTEANRLDDERSELEDELRDVEERIDAMEPFVDIGLELDLLSGYDSLEVAVGYGDDDAVEAALAAADDVAAFEVFEEDDAVAMFAYPEGDAEGVLEDALVGVEFARVEIPDASGDPAEHVEELEHRAQQLAAELDTVQESIDDLRLEAGGFLLAAEEYLTITVQKAEAPLSFATTDNAFVAEGWVPTERYDEFEAAVREAVGDRADVEELQRASFGSDGEEKLRETVVDDSPDVASERDAAGDDADDDSETEEPPKAVADGGGPVVMRDDDPPVVQDNPGPVTPFELLTKAVGRPNYTEFDPTIVLFLTFPTLFGFMIGDVGYGAIYSLIGLWVVRNFDSDGYRAFGQITIAAGLFTMLFGVLYGEVFGTHMFGEMLWHDVVGLEHAPIEKGLSPGSDWPLVWLIVTVLFGMLHLLVGWSFTFLEELEFHGFKAAMLESGSWILALIGIWTFVFSKLFEGSKPDLLFQTFASGEAAVVELGFSGLPAEAGWLGLGLTGLGFFLLALGPAHELVEFAQPFAHTLSYLRIAAVLLAKAGMAFAVNLLYFGAYVDEEGEYHFLIEHGPEYATEHGELMFAGLSNSGIGITAAGILVLILGHLVVLALGVTSSGIQAARLEYFEFFSKFFDGEGTPFEPFGREREHTTEE